MKALKLRAFFGLLVLLVGNEGMAESFPAALLSVKTAKSPHNHFAEFARLHAEHKLNTLEEVLGYVASLERADTFEAMATLFYLVDVGFDPERWGEIEKSLKRQYPKLFQGGNPWLSPEHRDVFCQRAQKVIENWISIYSTRYDLRVAAAMTKAWEVSHFEVESIPEKIFALHLMSNTALGHWDFVSTSQSMVISSLRNYMSHWVLETNPNLPETPYLARLKSINRNAFIAFFRQTGSMSRSHFQRWLDGMARDEGQKEVFRLRFGEARQEFHNRRESEQQKYHEMYLAIGEWLKSSEEALSEEEVARYGQWVEVAVNDLLEFWSLPSPEFIQQLRRLRTNRGRRYLYAPTSDKVDYLMLQWTQTHVRRAFLDALEFDLSDHSNEIEQLDRMRKFDCVRNIVEALKVLPAQDLKE